jgi:hypothetical protein
MTTGHKKNKKKYLFRMRRPQMIENIWVSIRCVVCNRMSLTNPLENIVIRRESEMSLGEALYTESLPPLIKRRRSNAGNKSQSEETNLRGSR